MTQRQERYAQLIQEELAMLISREVKDPRVADAGLVTITQVRVTPDLSMARVAVVLHGGDQEKERGLVAGLERAAPFLRAQLRRTLDSKKTPELRFEIDAGAEASDRIGAILRSIKDEPKPTE